MPYIASMNPDATDIYQYSSAQAYLNACLCAKKARNPSFSIRAWSRKLGYENPSLLSYVLSGKRGIPHELASRFDENLELTEREREFFRLQIRYDKAKEDSARQTIRKQILRCSEFQFKTKVQEDALEVVGQWYYTVLMEMIDLYDFKEDCDWIAKRLGGNLSSSEIAEAIKKLLEVGIFKRDPRGKLVKNNAYTWFGNDIPSESIKSHHRQFIDKARHGIDNQSLEERDYSGSTVAIKKSNLPKFRKAIEEFHTKIHDLSTDCGDEIYRFNVQMFRLTESTKPIGKSVNRKGKK